MFSTHKKVRGMASRRSGSATLELSITLSLLFLVSFGMVEFGYCFYVKNIMEGAAREGCRAGIVTGATTANCNSAIENQLQQAYLCPAGTTAGTSGSLYTIGHFTVTYMDNGTTVSDISTVAVGDTLTAQVTAVWGTVGANFRVLGLMPSTKVLTAASAMRKEGQ